MTYLGNLQGLAEVLLCPEEAEESMCLSSPEVTAAASGDQKSLVSDFRGQTQDQTKSH